ncbi:MAG TPA: MBL fold metallo-hydrolase [Archaeoglobaceae archaeon]|nr:MBL fold metallo-hydrolase [Archaeoglobaceae archaeon]
MKPLRIVTPPLGANSYLAGNIMIDVGGDTQFLLKKLSKRLKEVEYIFLTHSHFDHASAASDLKKIGCKVVMHRKEYETMKTYMSQFFAMVEPDIFVEGGEIFKTGGLKLKILHTPGHTSGSICLYEPDKKWLFSGDTVFPYGSFGRVDLPGGSAVELIRSLEMLSKLEVDMLYPGHEEPVKNGNHILNSLKNAKKFLI